jgi:hypothetical protein|tara:strand:+ start:92 stop:403 length:312 start_codon:yes stop_codon:yes gene_type:complete
MEKYRKSGEKVLGNKIHPDVLAKEALVNAAFASKERQEFFDDAYGELLVTYFMHWLKTEPHETKTREFIYNSALSLGDVRQKLVEYEMLGKNIKFMEDNNEND